MQTAKTAPRDGIWITKLNSTKLGIYEYRNGQVVGIDSWAIMEGKKLDTSSIKVPIFVHETAAEYVEVIEKPIPTEEPKREEYPIDKKIIAFFLGEGENESMTIKVSSIIGGLKTVATSGQ